ncbi:MAG0920 family protein [Mycoplasma enhydrae]|uniref:MAG0920 family protein n=1 Tax=Mycoplasma enhydrae TaxID=2499220 RepID=UPI00197B531E|nr:hypothetical protein [Mycoplasma enhydrae]MBN4089199.1 hypothetical protein [Mycoplasma enhydrae]
MTLNLTKNLNIAFLAIHTVIILLFFCTFIFYISFKVRTIMIKKDVSSIFLKNKIKVNQNFFNTFFKEARKIYIFIITFSTISIFLITISIISLVTILSFLFDGINSFWAIWAIASFSFGIAIFSTCLMVLFKIKIIHKEINIWKSKNEQTGNKLFEHLDTSDNNKELLNLFNDSKNLKMSFITKIYNQYDATFKLKFKKIKRALLKLKEGNFDDYLYYFLIFNYENVAINNQIFKVEDYAFLFQNRREFLKLLKE